MMPTFSQVRNSGITLAHLDECSTEITYQAVNSGQVNQMLCENQKKDAQTTFPSSKH